MDVGDVNTGVGVMTGVGVIVVSIVVSMVSDARRDVDCDVETTTSVGGVDVDGDAGVECDTGESDDGPSCDIPFVVAGTGVAMDVVTVVSLCPFVCIRDDRRVERPDIERRDGGVDKGLSGSGDIVREEMEDDDAEDVSVGVDGIPGIGVRQS